MVKMTIGVYKSNKMQKEWNRCDII